MLAADTQKARHRMRVNGPSYQSVSLYKTASKVSLPRTSLVATHSNYGASNNNQCADEAS